MASTANVPEKLKPYVAHGINLNLNVDLKETLSVYGDCPWCRKEGKFNVTLDQGLWRCNVCNIGSIKGGGNVYTFLRTLHKLSMEATPHEPYVRLAEEKKLLYPDTLKAWGVCKSIIDDTWIMPGYSVPTGTTDTGRLTQLFRYVGLKDSSGNIKRRWIVTAGLPTAYMGPDIPIPPGGIQAKRISKNGPVYRCEGPFDGMAFWEVAYRCRVEDGELVPTSNTDLSLLGTGSVTAVPGAENFTENWAMFSSGRPDYSFYDNDHPKQITTSAGVKLNKTVQAGLTGSQRAISILAKLSTPPKECRYLRWGETTFHNPSLPDGYDVRDYLSSPHHGGSTLAARVKALNSLLAKLQPIPDDWVEGRSVSSSSRGALALDYEPCTDYKTLTTAGRDALKWTEGIDLTFSAMLSSILSVPTVGNQVWLMVIGPPSSGKSTLCEALSVNRQYVLPKDTLTGLFSGWQAGLDKGENLSMANDMYDKTLVIKDGDTILRSLNRDKIMSELRALYDRCIRVQYKNKMSKDHEGLNCTVILCGTSTLFEMDSADRGARFLTVDIQPKADHDQEREIALRTAYSSFSDMTLLANGTAESRDSPALTRFKKLTGGYIQYLRENGQRLIDGVKDPDGSSLAMCVDLATFVSYMRCRPPKKQDEKVEREMPYRLTSQLVRMARGLAVVLNKTTLDADVMHRVRQIALHTAHGKVMTLCDYIRSCGTEGAQSAGIGHVIGETQDEAVKILRFLRKIEAVEPRKAPEKRGYIASTRPVWFLSPIVSKLYDSIFGAKFSTSTSTSSTPARTLSLPRTSGLRGRTAPPTSVLPDGEEGEE